MKYFMFSKGSYSDYSTGQLCSCDHEVTEKEWHEFYTKYQHDSEQMRLSIKPFVYDSLEAAAWRKWREDNNPEKAFIKLHNMTVIDYEELWRD